MIQNDKVFKFNGTAITGIGSALIDLLIYENDDFLRELGKEKGGMTLVQDADLEEILKRTSQKPLVVPGGAACNTIVGVGRLGGKARFIGKRGADPYGLLYEEQLKLAGVDTVFHVSENPTGRVLSIITQDAQRSMFTFLGASTELEPDKINGEMFKDTAIAVIEGYLLFNPELMMASLMAAKKAGAAVALDLASFEVVEASRGILSEIVKNHVDILIANEDEVAAYTGISDETQALEALARNVSLAVLKVGKRGSYIFHDGRVIRVAPRTGTNKNDSNIGGDALDTTGAGDLWAAGFLFGLANGYSLEKSGEIASACGYEVCQVVGAHIPEDGWRRIRALL